MKVPFYLFTIFLGIILAVHLSMNGKVGSALGNPRVGNAFFWCVGAATAVLMGALRAQGDGSLDHSALLLGVERLSGRVS